MNIKRVGYINEKGEIYPCAPKGMGDVAAILTSRELIPNERILHLKVSVTVKDTLKEISLPIQVIPNGILAEQLVKPALIEERKGSPGVAYFAVLLFKNHFYTASSDQMSESNSEEAILLIKKQVYSEDEKLSRLRDEISAIDRLIKEESRPARQPIPGSVKLLVYKRDQGKCVHCNSDKELHFDHIIPVSKGGGNSDENIQILCQRCNLKKSANIAF